MSSSLNITLSNARGLMETFNARSPKTNAQPPETNAQPFNILDYAKTAEDVSAMAQNLNTLIESMNQRAPEIQRLQHIVRRLFYAHAVLSPPSSTS